MKRLIIPIALILSGCGSSKISQLPVTHVNEPVKTIAISPSGGVLADAVSVTLDADGFNIIDSAKTTNMLTRSGLTETETYKPVALSTLKVQGIDAILNVRTVSGFDNQPESAVARITSTTSGHILSGVTWQNGWGGREGSIADRNMRKGLTESATEIAHALEKNIHQN